MTTINKSIYRFILFVFSFFLLFCIGTFTIPNTYAKLTPRETAKMEYEKHIVAHNRKRLSRMAKFVKKRGEAEDKHGNSVNNLIQEMSNRDREIDTYKAPSKSYRIRLAKKIRQNYKKNYEKYQNHLKRVENKDKKIFIQRRRYENQHPVIYWIKNKFVDIRDIF